MNICRGIQRTSVIVVFYSTCIILDSALAFDDVTPGKVGRNQLGNAHVERFGKGFLMFIYIGQTRRKNWITSRCEQFLLYHCFFVCI